MTRRQYIALVALVLAAIAVCVVALRHLPARAAIVQGIGS